MIRFGLDRKSNQRKNLEMPRFTFKLEYDGSRFEGWPELRAALEAALTKNKTPTSNLTVAEETEPGVHASSEIVHLDLAEDHNPLTLKADLSEILRGTALAIVGASNVPDDFDASRAEELHYTYRLFSRRATLTFNKGTMWRIDHPLDIRAMREAAMLPP